MLHGLSLHFDRREAEAQRGIAGAKGI